MTEFISDYEEMTYEDYKKEFGIIDTHNPGMWQEIYVNCIKCKEALSIQFEVDLSVEGGALPQPVECCECGTKFLAAYELTVKTHVEPLEQ